MEWLNIYGLIIIIVMLIPNIIFAHKNPNIENKCKNKWMNLSEQIGRYGSFFLMIFNIGILELDFNSATTFELWLVATIILLLLYLVIWGIYFNRKSSKLPLSLAIIPSIIFILSGYLMRHYLLIICSILFTIGHVYVTHSNNKETLQKYI